MPQQHHSSFINYVSAMHACMFQFLHSETRQGLTTCSYLSLLVVRILGASGVEISAGFHWYLKHYSAAHISWYKTGGAQLSSIPRPGSLPRVPAGGVFIQRPVDWSYYQNTVTSSCKLITYYSNFLRVVIEVVFFKHMMCCQLPYHTDGMLRALLVILYCISFPSVMIIHFQVLFVNN